MYTVISNMIFTHYQSNGITLTHCVLKYSYICTNVSRRGFVYSLRHSTQMCFFSFEISTLTELAINCLAGSDWR